jgi:ferredoxin--NADP+ reductase
MTLGTETQPLNVAIVGAGPSGFYAADYLQNKSGLVVNIDMYDRLPTPYGLVRGGVAPDHQKIKAVTKVYDKIASHPRFRFFGNVTFGRDITREDLRGFYHAVIYAVGAQTDRALGIPGEDLLGSYAATDFVGWYNGHPDYKQMSFDLTRERVAVIGVGNVAMDVTRILASTHEELASTDIADYALDALKASNVKQIYVFGRRGAAQAAFTNPEIKELGELEGADCIVLPEEVALDDVSKAYLASGKADPKDSKNVDILQAYAQRPPAGKPKQIFMRFLWSPTAILGDGRVEAIQMVKNALIMDDNGNVKAVATDHSETFAVDLVFRSVGYMGVPLPDVPFDAKRGTFPHAQGRVLRDGQTVVGDYVVGWIKRGPSGVIGTNKPDSYETAEKLVEDAKAGILGAPATPDPDAVTAFLQAKGVCFFTFADWQALDRLETERGQAEGKPRHKFTDIDAMLAALGK